MTELRLFGRGLAPNDDSIIWGAPEGRGAIAETVGHMFSVNRLDTREIALLIGLRESTVYNALALYRERQRSA